MKKSLLLLCLAALSFTGIKSQSWGGTTIQLGNAVTTENELATEGQLFVLKGNAVRSFSTSSGLTYTGSGPIYMQYAEAGDTQLSQRHVMQLIPFKDGKYLVYWPSAGMFLQDSYEGYNGVNGWQYSTYSLDEAAVVEFKATKDGYFEMSYESKYNGKPVTFYVGAELRDGVLSKMKTFDYDHKLYLEAGNYNMGYSLPIAFNWSIYKAEIDKSYVNVLTMQYIAYQLLYDIQNKAFDYAGAYDDYCKNGENRVLNDKLELTNTLTTTDTNCTFEDIYKCEEELTAALNAYVATKLSHYNEIVDDIAEHAEYSSFPNYIKGTYPTSSRKKIARMQDAIAEAQDQEFTIEQYEALYSQLERDIELFESTIITEDTAQEELLFVYLSNGEVDAFAVSDMDGKQYIENGKLYIPLKGDEFFYYDKEEYDSCSSTRPALPTIESFKFNNKYNPNLHVDAIADITSNEIDFRLNAIGKWLTASFTLSDDKAVAYVDTTLQISKETRQSFENDVIYDVTYPGYSIVKNIKVQDEIWSTPIGGTKITEVQLTEKMLYTNKPSTQSNEGLGNLLDGSSSTIFHSTWGSANDATVNVNAYISIDLPEALEKIQIYYQCRPQRGYNPKVWEIYASNDGNYWQFIRSLDYIADNMPTGGAGQEFTSNTIDLGDSYSKIRIIQTYGEYSKNHLAIAELRIRKVEELPGGDPVKIQDEKYETKRIPYGNKYKVTVDWLTDNTNSVPRIDIDIDGGAFVTSKEKYLNANFRITGYGIYDNFEDSVQIKGRGNSSWSYSKKPYRLKFSDKVKPFGLTKGKSWVLLANAQNGSLMANAISMKIGQLTGAEYTNHIVPVELYMNGEYMGSYMFTEKVGLANNSVDVDEDTGHLLELDTNSDDEYKFTTTSYSIPVFIKEPDLNDSSLPNVTARRRNIPSQFNEFCTALYQGRDINSMVDMDALASFILVNDLSLNQELGHPKSIFLFKENENSSSSKYKFGPIWDFDWGYGYENGYKYCYSSTVSSSLLNSKMSTEPGYKFFNDLLKVESFKKHYYKAWVEFINNNCMEELLDYIDHYYSFAESSFRNNASTWGSSCGFTADDKDRHKSWVESRMNYIYSNLTEYDITDIIYKVIGDVNCNNQLTIHDAALVTAYLNGNIDPSFNTTKADCDESGNIDIDDARAIASMVEEGEAPIATYWYSKPQTTSEFSSDDFVLEMNDVQSAGLSLLDLYGENHKAMQFDITLPEGVSLIDIMNSNAMSEHNFTYFERAGNVYRILAYSDNDECFSTGDEPFIEMILTAENIINEDNCLIKISNAYIVDNENNELRIGDHAIRFSQSTGIAYNGENALIEGGDYITVTLLEPEVIDVYSTDGRKVRSINAKKGTTRIAIPAGIYIVNGEKVVVR